MSMIQKRGLIRRRVLFNILQQIAGWKSNLDDPKSERRRKDCDQKATVQSIQFWLMNYYNGMVLMGWVKNE